MIYVVSHKNESMQLPDDYKYIYVGQATKEIDGLHDSDSLDNISDKNPYYCELTAYYYLWKNTTDEIIGIDHYRRFLSWKKYSQKSKHLIKPIDLKDLKVDFIVPKKYTFGGKYRFQNLEEVNKSFEITRTVIEKIYPKYLIDFDKVLDSKSLHLCNMLITYKTLFDDYCNWLFNILENVEPLLDYKNYQGNAKRVFGYISEALLNVYLAHNDFKIKEVYISIPGSSLYKRFKNRIRHYFDERRKDEKRHHQ